MLTTWQYCPVNRCCTLMSNKWCCRSRETMSWNSYIDSVIAYSRDLLGNTHIDKACIIGMDGGILL